MPSLLQLLIRKSLKVKHNWPWVKWIQFVFILWQLQNYNYFPTKILYGFRRTKILISFSNHRIRRKATCSPCEAVFLYNFKLINSLPIPGHRNHGRNSTWNVGDRVVKRICILTPIINQQWAWTILTHIQHFHSFLKVSIQLFCSLLGLLLEEGALGIHLWKTGADESTNRFN